MSLSATVAPTLINSNLSYLISVLSPENNKTMSNFAYFGVSIDVLINSRKIHWVDHTIQKDHNPIVGYVKQ